MPRKGKKVRVALFGRQNRSIMVDADATDGAVLGENLFLDDGVTLVTMQNIVQEVTNIINPGTPGPVSLTLWELIQGIPAFILSLAGLTGTGIVVKGAGDTAFTRTIVPEDERITVADGDGVAGNPTIGLTNWPTVKTSIEAGETYTIMDNHQLLVFDEFIFDGGNLTIDGELVLL